MVSLTRLASMVGCLLLLGCGAAHDPPQQRLFDGHNLLRNAGYPLLGPISTGEIGQGETRTLRADLVRDACYVLAVFGGDGLEDIGLSVGVPEEEPLAQDHGTGRSPAVSFCAERAGEHQVTVTARSGSGMFQLAYWIAGGAGGGPGGQGGGETLVLGRPVEGTLPMDRPYLDYTLRITEPRTVTIDLESPDFDAYLYLLLDGSVIDENDDTYGLNSQIVRFMDPGVYTVRVSSFMQSGGGMFTLMAR